MEGIHVQLELGMESSEGRVAEEIVVHWIECALLEGSFGDMGMCIQRCC